MSNRSDRKDHTGSTTTGQYPQKVIRYINYKEGYECQCIKCNTITNFTGQRLISNNPQCPTCKAETTFQRTPQNIDMIVRMLYEDMTKLQIIKAVNKRGIPNLSGHDIDYIRINYSSIDSKQTIIVPFSIIAEELNISQHLVRLAYSSAIAKLQQNINKEKFNEEYEWENLRDS